MKHRRFYRLFAWCCAVLVTVTSLLVLEDERLSATQSHIETDAGRVVLYQHTSGSGGPVVIIAHGFAGSHQMLQYIARDLARSGYNVAAFDFIGHGRNTQLLSPDVTRIEGTTAQLVNQTLGVIPTVRAHFGQPDQPFAMLGHSMATDIIIRAARQVDGADSLVTISMYSDVVTATFPKNLLILSGQWEGRLRDVGLRLIAQVDPDGVEGQTVTNANVSRRSVSVPLTEHVAVLFDAVTQQETRDWLDTTLAATPRPQAPATAHGMAILGALIGLVAVFVLTVRPMRPVSAGSATRPLGTARFCVALALPAAAALVAAAVVPPNLLGMSAFGTLFAFLVVWGAVQLTCLGSSHLDLSRPSLAGVLVLLAGAALFALVLDRYAAAFLPVGSRLTLMCALLPATFVFAIADRMLVGNAVLWKRCVARVVPVIALGLTMALVDGFGLLFTVVPVLALFYLVYGTMGRAIAQRFGPMTAGIALGVVLAWSIAASTPLFAI